MNNYFEQCIAFMLVHGVLVMYTFLLPTYIPEPLLFMVIYTIDREKFAVKIISGSGRTAKI